MENSATPLSTSPLWKSQSFNCAPRPPPPKAVRQNCSNSLPERRMYREVHSWDLVSKWLHTTRTRAEREEQTNLQRAMRWNSQAWISLWINWTAPVNSLLMTFADATGVNTSQSSSPNRKKKTTTLMGWRNDGQGKKEVVLWKGGGSTCGSIVHQQDCQPKWTARVADLGPNYMIYAC